MYLPVHRPQKIKGYMSWLVIKMRKVDYSTELKYYHCHWKLITGYKYFSSILLSFWLVVLAITIIGNFASFLRGFG